MNDTSPEFEAMLDERYRRMTPDERVRIAASMYAALIAYAEWDGKAQSAFMSEGRSET